MLLSYVIVSNDKSQYTHVKQCRNGIPYQLTVQSVHKLAALKMIATNKVRLVQLGRKLTV